MQLHSIYEVETIAEGMDHPECLAFDLAGNGVAGGEAGQLYRFRLDGHVEEVANTGGGIGGICVDGKNKVVECNYGLLKVQQVDVNGEISVLSSGIESAPFVMPNFPVWDEHGNLFVTDSGNFYKPSGRLFRISKDGTTACVYGGHLHFPNGLVISPDGKWLYMIQSTAVNILRFSLSNGIIGEPELYFTLPGTVPDGLAFSESGNLYVACYTPDIIYRITPNRILQTVVADPYGERLNRPTNVAFAPGTTMLCFANLGGYAIHGLDVGEKGAPLFYP